MKQPSQRQLRVSELVRHAVANILVRGELRDPSLDGIVITVPEVRMSPDLKHADILVMPLGGNAFGQDKQEFVLSRLNANARRMRGVLAKRINLKYMPDVRFHLDEQFDKFGKIEALLNLPRVKQDLERDRSDEEDEA